MEENFSDFVIFIVNVATFLIGMTLAYFIGSNFYHNVIEEESSGEAGSAVAIHDYFQLDEMSTWFSLCFCIMFFICSRCSYRLSLSFLIHYFVALYALQN